MQRLSNACLKMQSCLRTKVRLLKGEWGYNKNMDRQDSQLSEGNELAKLTPKFSNEVHKAQWHLFLEPLVASFANYHM
jgi:hypothetical protein